MLTPGEICNSGYVQPYIFICSPVAITTGRESATVDGSRRTKLNVEGMEHYPVHEHFI